MAKARSFGELLGDVALGAIAGTVASALMQPAGQAFLKVLPKGGDDPEAKKKQEATKNDPPATEQVAQRVFRPLGIDVSGDRQRQLGQLVHYGYGAFWGGVYGALAGRNRGAAVASGLLLGVGLFLVGDELLVPRLGLSRKANEYPLETHARAFASHLAYGTATDGLYRALRPRLH